MIESGFYIDMKDFDKKFNNLMKNVIPEHGDKGAFNAMNRLLEDAITKPPQAPKDIGDLWGSRIVKKAKREGKESFTEGGFNIKYARRHHEVEPGTFKYTISAKCKQPGPKFLESKMAQFKEKYGEIIAETIRKMSK
ncbi:unnamed protein product [marine sediment metagenome]|uniref:HK97 gp10 family phage protein n=1 Tax=marine sediment metagenome TaxID=412755 RepID=X1MID5_9ZZZZ